ncbi:MAG: gluconate 2-dehydrogenase subunit 3 family protein [Bryobacteraceae bacterium]
MSTRRHLLGAAAALPILGQHTHSQEPPASYKPRAFTAAELDLVRDLAETIIPRTDTPGAADAGVHLYIDRVLSDRGEALAAFRKGLGTVETARRGGKTLTAILSGMSKARDPFFRQLKDLTIDGYYSSKEGLATELGWHGYTPLPEFKGCTHPEHQGAKKG